MKNCICGQIIYHKITFAANFQVHEKSRLWKRDYSVEIQLTPLAATNHNPKYQSEKLISSLLSWTAN